MARSQDLTVRIMRKAGGNLALRKPGRCWRAFESRVRQPGIWLASEQFQEFVPAHAGGFDDLIERALGEIAAVHRDNDTVTMFGVPEDVVAPLHTVELPATAFESSNRLARCDGRKPRRHASTVTRSISIGPGTGSPWASRDSR